MVRPQKKKNNFLERTYLHPPNWVIDRPQPAIVDLLARRELRPGWVLDVGCGTGDNSLLLAEHGHKVVAVEIASDPIQKARALAHSSEISIEFCRGSGLNASLRDSQFDNVVDSGLFHGIAKSRRVSYCREITRLLCQDGKYFVLSFSADEIPCHVSALGVTKFELQSIFGNFLHVNYIRDAFFELRNSHRRRHAYLLSAEKT